MYMIFVVSKRWNWKPESPQSTHTSEKCWYLGEAWKEFLHSEWTVNSPTRQQSVFLPCITVYSTTKQWKTGL